MSGEEYKKIQIRSMVSSIINLCVCLAFCVLVYVVGKMTLLYLIVCFLGIMLNSVFLGYLIFQYISFKRSIDVMVTVEQSMKELEEWIKQEQESPFEEFNSEKEK